MIIIIVIKITKIIMIIKHELPTSLSFQSLPGARDGGANNVVFCVSDWIRLDHPKIQQKTATEETSHSLQQNTFANMIAGQ